ncbi:hydroxybutyrate-dimer hydrolase [Orbus hercynius]|uniref:Hydroxybutyrate-dimer hydrolase n=1 Tax=Orbus hercynius TaxID=593135 RepID=A0A495RKA2_9GAMM|nr:3-hydroxybutyrate oligomer hydrolase family protein [Orbus hercynius]RKS87761.1 hydroxybutyrate-dimer hydrolase [Orbus hercynius]
MIKLKNITTYIVFFVVLSNYSISFANYSPLIKKNDELPINSQPAWLEIGKSFFYDGESDDLATAGYGFSQLSQIKVKNKFVDLQNPTFTELKRARLNRYIDTKDGEGEFFGFKKQSLTPLFDGRIAGTEIQAVLVNGDERVAFLLQVPLDFDKNNPCIIAVPATDSDGIYNAKDIQIRGLWGLNHNCAVVYNDKGLGNTIFDLDHQDGFRVDGRKSHQDENNNELIFNLSTTGTAKNYLNRYAIKQLHSKQNPEAKWGEYVLNSIEFAFYQLNEMFSPTREAILNKNNTYVLVYGAADGGGAALKAGEFDKEGIIDGIVAVNPQIQISDDPNIPLFIKRGTANIAPLKIKSLIDYSSYGALYIPCAALELNEMTFGTRVPEQDAFFFAENRCAALQKVGLLAQLTPKEQAKEALEKLYQYGWTPEMAYQLPYYYHVESINYPYKYISEYGRYGVDEHLCNYSVASIDTDELYYEGSVEPLTKTSFAAIWALNSGSLPIKVDDRTIVIDLVNDTDPKGAHREFFSRSKGESDVDYNLSGAICLRDKLSERRVLDGLAAVTATGKLNQIKTIIVHGQLNVKNLPDYSSRAYAALNSFVEGSFSNLRYIEVENASYLSGELPFDNTLVALDYYGESAMNWLWSNLNSNTTLPDSQMIRAKAREGEIGLAPSVTKANLVPIVQTAKQNDYIRIANGTIELPIAN